MARPIAKANSTNPTIEHATVPIGSVIPNPRNPRRHPPEQLELLRASIARFGQTRGVLVRRANMMLVAGHGVTEACTLAGLKQLNVVLWDVDQNTADAFMLGDNRLGSLGKDDAASVRELLKDLGFADPASIGYSAVEVEALLDEAAVDDIDILEIPTSQVADRFWISIRGPLASQAEALKGLLQVMKDIPGVEVELGTIADV